MYSSLALDFLMIKITIPPRNKTGFADKKSRLLLTKKQTACGHTTDEKKRMKKKGDFGKQPWFFVGFSWKNHRSFFKSPSLLHFYYARKTKGCQWFFSDSNKSGTGELRERASGATWQVYAKIWTPLFFAFFSASVKAGSRTVWGANPLAQAVWMRNKTAAS